MPNKQSSRTQRPRKTRTKGGMQAAAGPVWPTGRQVSELKTYSFQNGNYQLYHNVPVTMANTLNLLDSIAQGTTYITRVGNRIQLRRLRARLVFNNKTDRPNVSYRISVVAAPTNVNTDTFSELFSYGGFTGMHLPQNSLLLYDTTFPLNQGSGMENNVTPNKERSFNHTLDIPINRAVVYNTSDNKASTTLTVWLTAYDAYGTLTTDNIASVAQVTWALDYVDP